MITSNVDFQTIAFIHQAQKAALLRSINEKIKNLNSKVDYGSNNFRQLIQKLSKCVHSLNPHLLNNEELALLEDALKICSKAVNPTQKVDAKELALPTLEDFLEVIHNEDSKYDFFHKPHWDGKSIAFFIGGIALAMAGIALFTACIITAPLCPVNLLGTTITLPMVIAGLALAGVTTVYGFNISACGFFKARPSIKNILTSVYNQECKNKERYSLVTYG